jgi:hypothetical protein
MDTVEIPPILSRDSRRLVKAIALLLAGAAVHVWLFPAVSRPGRPGVLERVTANATNLMEEQIAATTGDTAGSRAVVSVLGHVSRKGGHPVPRTDSAARVRVVIQDVRPSIARPAIDARPMGLQNAMMLTPAADRTAEVTDVQGLQATLDTPQAETVADNMPSAALEVAARHDPVEAALEPLAPPAYVAPRGSELKAAALHQESRSVEGPSDERLVSSVLQQYRAAYESLDVNATQSIWPTVDARALGAAFRQLAGQRVTFDSCGVRVSGSGSQATARCTGQAEYVPKVGNRRAYVASGEWVFDLAKQDAAWRIVNANASVK